MNNGVAEITKTSVTAPHFTNTPSTNALRPSFTVEETIHFYGTLVDTSVDVENVLEEVGLFSVRQRQIRNLSGRM